MNPSTDTQGESILLPDTNGTTIGMTRFVPDADAAYRKVLTDVLATDHEIVGGETKSVGSKKRS